MTTDPILENDETVPEFRLIDVLTALGEEKLTWLMVTFLAGLVGVAVSLLTTPMYSARSVILPAQQGGGGASTLASLGALSGMAGLSGLGAGMKSSEDMYIAFMRSESVQNSLIEKLDLKQRYHSRNIEEAQQALSDNVALVSDRKSGLISVSAQDTDPQFAARLANAQVAELNILLSRLAVTEAQQRRLFYEKQIEKTQQSLSEIEARFRQAQEKSGLQFTSLMAETGIRASAEIRGQIAAKEIQVQALSRFATPQNQDMLRLSSELSALRMQLQKYEQGSGHSGSATPLRQDALDAYRDLKVQEAKLDAFVRQLEAARIDEAKEGPAVQVVDVALAPERRSKPERRKMVIAYLVTGILLGVVAALLKALWRRASQSVSARESLIALKRSWSFKARS